MADGAKSKPSSGQPSDFESFANPLRKVASIRKTEFDLHEPRDADHDKKGT